MISSSLYFLRSQTLPYFLKLGFLATYKCIPDANISIDGYQFFRKDRICQAGGGVALYYKETLDVSRRSDIKDDDTESIWIEHRFSTPVLGYGKCIICSLYHPPNADRVPFSNHLQNALEIVSSFCSTPLILIGGDFNRTSVPALQSLKQIVSKPTRGDVTLDCVYTNLNCVYNNDRVVILPPIGNSDHNVVFVKPLNNVTHNQFPSRSVTLRHRTPSNVWSFGCYLYHINWYPLLLLNSVQDIADIFYQVFNFGFDEFIPTKTYSFSLLSKPWFNERLMDIHSAKRKAFSSTSGKFHGSSYAEWNKRFKVECSKSKKDFLLRSCSSTKSFWNAVSTIMGNCKTSSYPSILSDDVQANYGSIDLTEAFSQLFQRKWTQKSNLVHMGFPAFAPTITAYDTHELLKNMPSKGTCGPDAIPSWVLQKYACLLAVPVTLLFNLALQSALIPSQWCVQKVIPVPKTSKSQLLKDYRPIAVSSSLGKALEKFVTKSLLDFLGPNFDKTQYGFRRGSSCSVALISTIHQWLLNLEKSKEVHAVFLDFSAAFDSVPHSVIINKMIKLDIPEWIISYTIAFLKKRIQFVEIAGSRSKLSLVRSGVPQGSIISPTLFAISVHDFPSNVDVRVCKYADDTTIWTAGNKSSLGNNLSDFCRDVVTWCQENSLTLNASKSAEMFISLGPPRDHDPLFILNEEVPLVRETKFLGILLKDNLSWSTHIDSVISKASRALFLLRRFRSFGANESDLSKLYNAFFLPSVEYCSSVWDGNLSKLDCDRLEALNRRAITTCRLDTKCSLAKRRETQRLSLFSKALRDPAHLLHQHIPSPISHCRTTRLRLAGALEIPRARLSKFKNSFIVKTAADFNRTLYA